MPLPTGRTERRISGLLSNKKIERQKATHTYMAAKKAAIIFKISVSLFALSSNPGVSIRVTVLPSRVKLSTNPTRAVHNSGPIPIRRFETLARLINWTDSRRVSGHYHRMYFTYSCFATSGYTHDPAVTIKTIFRQEGRLPYTYAILMV